MMPPLPLVTTDRFLFPPDSCSPCYHKFELFVYSLFLERYFDTKIDSGQLYISLLA